MRNVSILAGCAAVIVLMSGCGSDAPATSTSTSTAASTATTSSAPPTTTSPATSTGSSGASSARLEAALLPASEVGTGFARTVSDTGDNDPLPCTPDAAPVREQVPPDEYLGGTYRRADAQVSENVFLFGDDAAAQRFVAVSKTGLGCSSVTIEGEKYTLRGPKQLALTGADLDESVAWDLLGTKFVSTLVLTRSDERIVAFTFVATPGSADSINVPSVVGKAVARADDEL